MQNRIFSTDSPKAIKADAFGYLNAIHYMAPHRTAQVGDLCGHASPGCIALCLGLTSGQAGMVKDVTSNADQTNNVRRSRRAKAIRFMRERAAYMADVVTSMENLARAAAAKGKRLCVRLNGSTDIAWEGIACVRDGVAYRNVFAAFPAIQFVDYTKNPNRFARPLPANYHLTFSRSETNEPVALDLLRRGFNVAVVFANGRPDVWQGYQTVDGDQHDLRHLDPRGGRGHVIALSPKGRVAKRDVSGFVVRTAC